MEWFDAVDRDQNFDEVGLANHVGVRFDDLLLNAVETVFNDDRDELERRFMRIARERETTFWLYSSEYFNHVVDGRCDLGPLMIEYVKSENIRVPGAARASWGR